MKIPFTVDQFFDVFEVYNRAIWPAQIVAYVLGIAAVCLAARDIEVRSRIVAGILSVFWAWMGMVYHFIYFSQINPAARVFGVAFLLQGLILALFGMVFVKFRFRFTASPITFVGILFILYAIAIYPLIGKISGHSYPRSPIFGVTPCPATIFTFGLLLWASRPVPLYVVVIPFLWSLIGISAAINLRIPQDYGLGIAGILGTLLVVVNNRKLKRETQKAPQADTS
jgi:hypothetical protein